MIITRPTEPIYYGLGLRRGAPIFSLDRGNIGCLQKHIYLLNQRRNAKEARIGI
jgi:hypothetical protein